MDMKTMFCAPLRWQWFMCEYALRYYANGPYSLPLSDDNSSSVKMLWGIMQMDTKTMLGAPLRWQWFLCEYALSLMLLVANLANTKWYKKNPEKWWKAWRMGTHLKILSLSYLSVLVLGPKVVRFVCEYALRYYANGYEDHVGCASQMTVVSVWFVVSYAWGYCSVCLCSLRGGCWGGNRGSRQARRSSWCVWSGSCCDRLLGNMAAGS